MLKVYETEQFIRTRDADVNGHWRPSAILETMQEAAGTHSAILGCGRDVLIRQNMVWILSRVELQMDRYPSIGETIRVATMPMPLRRFFFPRYYIFTDEQGKEIGRGGSLWLLLDINTRRMMPPGDVASLLPDNSDLKAPLGMPPTVELLEGEETVLPCHPVYTDLDVNGHVNNTKYADWLCNALGFDTMKAYTPKSIVLNYNAEVLPEHELSLHLVRNEERFRLTGYHGEKAAFDIGGELMERK